MTAKTARWACDVVLTARGPKGAWTHVLIPFDAVAVFGRRGLIPVAGTLNAHPFRSSLMPDGTGTHYLNVNKTMLAGAKACAGDVARLVLELDTAERTVEVPVELAAALEADPALSSKFAAFSHSHRKEYADWVGNGKKAETRVARAQKAMSMIAAGKRSD